MSGGSGASTNPDGAGRTPGLASVRLPRGLYLAGLSRLIPRSDDPNACARIARRLVAPLALWVLCCITPPVLAQGASQQRVANRAGSACTEDEPARTGAFRVGPGEDFTWAERGEVPRSIRLAGLQSATDPRLAGIASTRLAEWTAQPVALVSVGQADRWDRTPALLLQGERLLNEALLLEGLARFCPGDVPARCGRLLAAAEAQARKAGRGGWSMAGGAPVFPILDAAGTPDWADTLGRFAIVEGRVAGIGETRSRIYLNFGAVRSEDFTVFVQKRNLRNIEASGMRWSSLEGRRIRVRGTLLESGGPLMEVNSPEAIERLD